MIITIKKGLDIPINAQPEGALQNLPAPKHVALSLQQFEEVRFRLLVKTGDSVKIGTPLVESKIAPGLYFVSPGAGVITEIRRGVKRKLLDIVIQLDSQESFESRPPLDLASASTEAILTHLLAGGVFPHIRMRPFDLVARPDFLPRDIFVRAVESFPYRPSAEMQVAGEEENFRVGLATLAKLTKGRVHLVYRKGCTCPAFTEAASVERHTVSGPHPVGTTSPHIHFIAPIRSAEDIVWTLTALDVVVVGKMVREGKYHTKRVVSVAGNGIQKGKRGFFVGREGMAVIDLIANRLRGTPRLIAGDPLTGVQVEERDFLNYYDTCFCAIEESVGRQPFHFLRLGANKYSFHRAYASGFLSSPQGGYHFTTNQHGEERAFIDGSIYDKVMPMRIPTALLIKAILSENSESAEAMGLFEVASEDFALPTFICPSKIEMIEIARQGLVRAGRDLAFI